MANKILKEYLLTGYVINEERTLVTNDYFLNLKSIKYRKFIVRGGK